MDDELFEYLDGDMSGNEKYVRYNDDGYEDDNDYSEENDYDYEEEEEDSSDEDYDQDELDDREDDQNSDEEGSDNDSSDNDSGDGSSSGGGAAAAGGSAAAVALVTVAIVVTTIINGYKVIINDLTVYAKSLVYDISVETEYKFDAESPVDWNAFNTGLQLVISSDDEEDVTTLLDTGMEGTEVEVKAKSDAEDNDLYEVTMRFKGKIEGLTAHHPYTIAVKSIVEGNGKTYYKGSFTTTEPVSRINAISGYCTCNKDGIYHFKLEYEDPENYYSGFEYRLLDIDGTELLRYEIDEPDKEQEIHGVDQIKGADKLLVISFQSAYESDLKAEHKVTELSSGTKMEVHKGMVTITQNILL